MECFNRKFCWRVHFQFDNILDRLFSTLSDRQNLPKLFLFLTTTLYLVITTAVSVEPYIFLQ
ncbi:hypothetical protein [Pleurocapsa sp. PCC 7319]|uniref:hypothetical protein n=1 Tax=Pleurocapsa sp. PCC 7319 TaxID=118161 RepID=UPI000349E7A3|nr:hypothetical protein [Pleurocapsa sp. PCC 7319]